MLTIALCCQLPLNKILFALKFQPFFSKLWQDKAKLMLQTYLDNVLVDDRLNQSEIVYSFLSPSPDYLKTASSLPPSIARYRKSHISMAPTSIVVYGGSDSS